MALELPWEWWRMDGVEFYDQFSFLKGGLAWTDVITTVSPSYAEEIQTPAFGCGLEGLLQHRRSTLTGIVNGIDTEEWNPGTDRHLAAQYNRRSLSKKAVNKQALQNTFGLPQMDTLPLIGFIGRLVEQKGVALMLEALPSLLAEKACQFVVLGSGDASLEQGLLDLATRYPEQMQVRIGYDESLSHQIEAGSDIFLMPSLFEPCGLNQLYSQRYGTVPLAHYVGGLRDTIINLSPTYSAGVNALEVSDETGFLFAGASALALGEKLRFALACFDNKSLWRKLQINGMSQDFSWKRSAAEYLALYQSA